MRKIIAGSFSLLILVSCNLLKKSAQKPEAPKTTENTVQVNPATVSSTMPNAMKTLPSGLEYQIFKHGSGMRKPVIGDHIEMQLSVSVMDSTHKDDTIVFDSRKMHENKPVPLQVTKPKFKGDPVEGYMQLVVGDSAVLRLPVDSLKNSGNPTPPWMKEGKKIQYDVLIVSIKNDSEARKELEIQTAMQKETDEKLLQEYFSKNNLKPVKTASGMMYYIIHTEGTGELPKPGNTVSIYYTGQLLNGTIFDSNEDSTFHHQDPLRVELGRGKVIKGWDEGLAYLKKGATATLYIPSFLAYGPRDRGLIPANSILIFDVKVKDIQTQAEIDDKSLQSYFKDFKIKSLKTASGLYYTIDKKGKGPNAKAGQTVSVRYTGKTMDGKIFDTNTDTATHKEPLTFELGKGRVIPGWEEGIALLNKGEKATLYIPSDKAYGPRGQGKKIPPNSVLVFEVELVDIK